jgi:hypothetical protein
MAAGCPNYRAAGGPRDSAGRRCAPPAESAGIIRALALERVLQKLTDFCDQNSLQLLIWRDFLILERFRSRDKRASSAALTCWLYGVGARKQRGGEGSGLAAWGERPAGRTRTSRNRGPGNPRRPGGDAVCQSARAKSENEQRAHAILPNALISEEPEGNLPLGPINQNVTLKIVALYTLSHMRERAFSELRVEGALHRIGEHGFSQKKRFALFGNMLYFGNML